MTVSVRPARHSDIPFLGEMLCEAGYPPDAPRPPLAEALAGPRLARYLHGWGRHGDIAVVAEEEGQRLGAAWCRLFDDAATQDRGVLDGKTPELVIAVTRDRRGAGIGGALLSALLGRARLAGFASLSLGVGETNPAIRLYERVGFVKVETGGRRWTMRCDL